MIEHSLGERFMSALSAFLVDNSMVFLYLVCVLFVGLKVYYHYFRINRDIDIDLQERWLDLQMKRRYGVFREELKRGQQY